MNNGAGKIVGKMDRTSLQVKKKKKKKKKKMEYASDGTGIGNMSSCQTLV